MAISEHDRHDLYEGLEEVLGRERATILMEHLPPVGWADVATKRDLDHVERSLRGEISQLGDRLRAEWRHELLLQTFAVIGTNVALAGALFAALR